MHKNLENDDQQFPQANPLQPENENENEYVTALPTSGLNALETEDSIERPLANFNNSEKSDQQSPQAEHLQPEEEDKDNYATALSTSGLNALVNESVIENSEGNLNHFNGQSGTPVAGLGVSSRAGLQKSRLDRTLTEATDPIHTVSKQDGRGTKRKRGKNQIDLHDQDRHAKKQKSTIENVPLEQQARNILIPLRRNARIAKRQSKSNTSINKVTGRCEASARR